MRREKKKDLLSSTRSTYTYILKMLYNHYLSDLVHKEEKKREREREREKKYKESGIYIYIYMFKRYSSLNFIHMPLMLLPTQWEE
jgi:hypothetical protein